MPKNTVTTPNSRLSTARIVRRDDGQPRTGDDRQDAAAMKA